MATLFKRGGKGIWYVQYFDHTGKRRSKTTRTTVYEAAKRIADKLEAEAAIRRERVIDPREEAIALQTRRPLAEHIADYRAKLKAAGRDDRYVSHTVSALRAVAAHCQFSTAADVNPDTVNRYALHLRDLGRSSRTVQSHLRAIKSLTSWMTKTGKLLSDPLVTVSPPNPQEDRRRERRMLLPDEWEWLRTVTLSNGATRFGIHARERVLLYATAIQTGLRSNELRSLTRGRLFLDRENPFVTCKASRTKNRKDARQYIQSDLAGELASHIAAKTPKAPVFRMPEERQVAELLREDLAAARDAWVGAARRDVDEFSRRETSDFLQAVNHEGEHLDFHSLRHTTGAWLAMTGAHPKAVQSVMRHATIGLTMDTYGHMFPGQEAETVARFPAMMGTSQPIELRATGTEGAAHALQSRRELMQAGAIPCGGGGSHHSGSDGRNPLPVAVLGDAVPAGATGCKSPGPDAKIAACRFEIIPPFPLSW